MITVSHAQLFQFLQNGGQEDNWPNFQEVVTDDPEGLLLDEATFTALKECDLKSILSGSEMSTDHLGGDDLVGLADDVVQAIEFGYTIATWYGPNSEALVCGYRVDEIKLENAL